MHARVVDHEPALALFVPDADPLLFYCALVRWCEDGGLSEAGWLGMECHHAFAGDVAALLSGFRPLETRGNPGRLAGQAKACCGPT